MRIIVDAFGGDNAPLEVIKGARLAADEYGCQVILAGDSREVCQVAGQNNISLDGIEIVNAEGAIPMEAKPTDLLRKYKGCSMEVAFQQLAEDKADAIVTAGSTGAALTGGTFIAKRIKGVKRPCIAAYLPVGEKGALLVDCGANAECRPEMLCQFAVMGSIYMQKLYGMESPRVGLLNIGVEEGKGTDLQKEAYEMLKTAPVNFIGNVEAREIPLGGCDVIVADGFTGNIVLKLIEGMAKYFGGEIKKIMLKNPLTTVCALSMKGGVKEMKKKLDSSEHGGAPLLGLRKPVIKAHGNSDALAIKNAIRQAIACCESDVVGLISQNLAKVVISEDEE
ncbi:MAG: phosphate acyltransferase PlsX [Oscillospiraceae bacterium]|nr:phosphate acyltransferase PlsX [Oscillospiraceae bacterium]